MEKLIKKIILENVTFFGSSGFYIFLILFTFLIGSIKLSIWLSLGFLVNMILAIAIKLLFFRHRPRKERFSNILEKIDASTFPSIHSMRSVSMLIFFFSYYNQLYLTLLFLAMSIGVFFSRYYLKKHFLKDIIFGILLGSLISYLIISFI